MNVNSDNAGITLYPNPVRDKLYLNQNSGKTQLNMYNLAGIMVKTATVNAEPLDVSDLLPGMYMIITISGGVQSAHRIMKY